MHPSSKAKIIGTTFGILILLIGIFLFFIIGPSRESRPIESFSAKNPAPVMAAEDIVSAYLQQYKSKEMPRSMRISDYGILETEEMEAGSDVIYVHVRYWLRPSLPVFHVFHDWGEENDGRIVCDRALRLIRDPGNPNILNVSENSDYLTVQTQLQEQERRENEKLQNEYEIPHGFPQMQNTYCITDASQVLVSYNGGESWTDPIPVTSDVLTDLSDTKYHNVLPEGSYYITPEMTSFVYRQNGFLWCCHSTDQGKNWKISSITSNTYAERMLLSGWTSQKEGWLIVSYDRQMSTEAKAVFLTHDGGLSWEDQGRGATDLTSRMLKHGGFVTPDVGFLSFGPSNRLLGTTAEGYDIFDTSPEFYRTEDGGKTFSEIKLPIPETYDAAIFICAQAPVMEKDGTLSLLVDQGDSGDYLGGRVCLRFISEDLGMTWKFDQEFTPKEIDFGG